MGRSGGRLVPPAVMLPEDQGVLGWVYDPVVTSTSSAAVAGTLYLARIPLRQAASVTNVVVSIGTAGATLTAGRNFAGLWRADGTLVAVTADQSTAWASAGLKVMPLAGGPYALAAGYYYAGLWANGTTPPSFFRGTNNNGNTNNIGLSDPSLRLCTADTGLTTTAPNPFGPQSGSGTVPWFALT